MKLVYRHEIVTFQKVDVYYSKSDIEDIFEKKNNKTLKETLESKRYSGLRKYDFESADLNLEIGVYLKKMKNIGNTIYQKFLNKYGDSSFCEFNIDSFIESKGIYIWAVDEKPKYLGRCTDNFKKRINQGYGKISPKNCFLDGQATNCHINSLINNSDNIQLFIHLIDDKTTSEIKELETNLIQAFKFPWNIQKS